jgi:hypothetical protein
MLPRAWSVRHTSSAVDGCIVGQLVQIAPACPYSRHNPHQETGWPKH